MNAVTDVWARLPELDTATRERLADVLETRGADAQQQAFRDAFLDEVGFPDGARVLELGCGTGVLTRRIAWLPQVGSVVGVDPAPSLLERAEELASGLDNVEFVVGDARSLAFEDGSFDVAVFDSTLSHIPGPEAAVAEAFRVLRPSGRLAVFDGDYATTTVAIGLHDPLQACVDTMMDSSVTDRRLARRLAAVIRDAGFVVGSVRSHGYVEVGEGDYMLTVADRGADLLSSRGEISAETAAALKAEARRRVDEGVFFGHIAYASFHARKPG
jgi:ubiquinone/menaquinone biosynthesis C-methylase UbiE